MKYRIERTVETTEFTFVDAPDIKRALDASEEIEDWEWTISKAEVVHKSGSSK
jgi:hypothetical protein